MKYNKQITEEWAQGDLNELYKDKEKKVSTVIVFNNEGKILGVSRKTNKNDFGLPGGKLDPGETFEECAKREALEETGLKVFCLIPIFAREDSGFFAVCFLAYHMGEINNELEAGEVKWVDFEEITKGSFGLYNQELYNRMKELDLLPEC